MEVTFPLFLAGVPTVPGAGRGRNMQIPTINFDVSTLQEGFSHGVYACWITVDGEKRMGALHFGPRPVFKDSVTLEVHILDYVPKSFPESCDLTIIGRIRDVQNFPSKEALVERIRKDIEETRGILGEV